MRPMPSRARPRMLFRLNTEPSDRIIVRWTSTTALNGAFGTGVRKILVCAAAGRTVAGRVRRRSPEKAAKENRICALHRPNLRIGYSGAGSFATAFVPADFRRRWDGQFLLHTCQLRRNHLPALGVIK